MKAIKNIVYFLIYLSMTFVENLQWRYATKMFDITKKVKTSDIDELIEVFMLTPSSFGLQPWKIIEVKDEELRKQLLPYSWNQSQIVDASHLFVLARVNNITSSHVDMYLDSMVQTTWASREDLKGYEDMMKGFLANLTHDQKNAWADRQVMIASGMMMSFLAQKNIDSCPIEGFDKEKYNEILWLSDNWLSAVLVLPVGYRSENDKYAQRPKIRFSKQDVYMIK